MSERTVTNEPAATPLPETLDRETILTRVLPMSERSFARFLSAKKFPPPDLKFSRKQQFWFRSTVMKWLEAQRSLAAAR